MFQFGTTLLRFDKEPHVNEKTASLGNAAPLLAQRSMYCCKATISGASKNKIRTYILILPSYYLNNHLGSFY